MKQKHWEMTSRNNLSRLGIQFMFRLPLRFCLGISTVWHYNYIFIYHITATKMSIFDRDFDFISYFYRNYVTYLIQGLILTLTFLGYIKMTKYLYKIHFSHLYSVFFLCMCLNLHLIHLMDLNFFAQKQAPRSSSNNKYVRSALTW